MISYNVIDKVDISDAIEDLESVSDVLNHLLLLIDDIDNPNETQAYRHEKANDLRFFISSVANNIEMINYVLKPYYFAEKPKAKGD